MLGTVVEGRLVSTVSFDLRKQKSVLARPSGGRPDAVTVRSEIDQLILQINAAIQQLRHDTEVADAADTTAWQASEANLLNMINALRDRNTGQVTVSGHTRSLAEAAAAIPGVDTAAPATSYLSWFVVVNDNNPTENGIYTKSGGRVVRAPGYTESTALPAGFTIFDNYANQKYVVFDDAIVGANGQIASVRIGSWTRVEEIIANSPLHKVGPVIELLFNRGVFAINGNGELDFSVAFQQRLNQIEQQVQTNAAAISGLDNRVRTAENDIVQLGAEIDANTQAISSQTVQIQNLQTFDDQVNLRVLQLEGDVETLTTHLWQEAEINNQQTGRIEEINTAVTDARATIAAHTGQINTLTNNKLNSADLAGLVDAMFAERNKTFTLRHDPTRGYIKSVTSVVDEGVTYTVTTFQIPTGFGNSRFRVVDVSRANAPFAKVTPGRIERINVDTVFIEFRQEQNDDGTPNAIADNTIEVAVQKFYPGN